MRNRETMEIDHHEIQGAGARVAVAASGFALSAVTLNDIVAIVTIVYVLLQIGLLLLKYKNHFSGNRKNNG